MTGAVLTMLLSAATAAPGTASGTTTLVTCPTGTETVTFTPGLTLVPRPTTVHVEGTLGPCVSPSNPAINDATFIVNGSGTASCLTGQFASTMVVN